MSASLKTLGEGVPPRTKALLALGLVLGLAALTALGDGSALSLSRGGMGVGVLGGVGWWLVRRGRTGTPFTRAERMRVVSRTGLSQRCGLALVEAEGRSYLVAFGDGFAEIRLARAPRRSDVRPRRRARVIPLVKERLP